MLDMDWSGQCGILELGPRGQNRDRGVQRTLNPGLGTARRLGGTSSCVACRRPYRGRGLTCGSTGRVNNVAGDM